MEAVVVKRQIPDKVPINPWTWLALGRQVAGISPKQYCMDLGETAAKVAISSWKTCGYDNITFMAGASQEAMALGEWAGLKGNVKYPENDWCYTCEPWYVKTLEDIDRLSVPEVRKQPPLSGVVNAVRIAAKEVGSEVGISVRSEDPWVHSMQLRGTATFMYDVAMAEKNREVRKAIDKLTQIESELIVEYAKACREAGTWMHEWGGAGATQDAISFETYKQYVFGHYFGINRALRKLGIPTWHHLCGQGLSDLTFVAHLDADIYHVTQSVDLAKAKVLLGLTRTQRYDRQAIAGNINPSGALLLGNPKQVEEEVKRQIVAAAEGGGYVMSTGCAMAIDTPLENVKAWVRSRDLYGTYPLKFHAKGV